MSEQHEATAIRGVSRRDMLRSIALALTAAGAAPLTMRAAQHVHQAAAEEKQAGPYKVKAFTEHQYKTLQRLAELIIPADEVSGSAVDAGAPEFIDLLCSQNSQLADIYTGGLFWLDGLMTRVYSASFVDARPEQQLAVLDAFTEAARQEMVWQEEGKHLDAFEHFKGLGQFGGQRPEDLLPGLSFFSWMLRMTVDAFYTSPIGIKDVGYLGNTALSKYEVPREAIEYALKRSPFATG